MGRIVPAAVGAQLSDDITVPLYLVEMDFDPPTRFSTRQTVQVTAGNLFTTSANAVENLSFYNATLVMDNTLLVASALVLTEGVRDRGVRIWKMYGDGATVAASDLVKVFEGVMSSVPSIGQNTVKISCVTAGRLYGWAPRIYCAPPLCNHMPPAGTRIGSFLLESDT